MNIGLIENKDNKWSARTNNIHLVIDKKIEKLNHSIWRNKIIQFLHEGHDHGLHYSGTHCLSKKDIDKIQLVLKQTILDCRKNINESESEALVVFCLDWFQLA